MDEKQIIRISKFLSRHLRHDPAGLGLTLEPGGWVRVEDLLRGAREHGMRISRDVLDEVVATNNKQRFAFDETGEKIRANQGHSVEVDLQLEPVEPPAVLYHGTGHLQVEIVEREGLKRMRRHHVHLSLDIATARQVGGRHGRPVIFTVDAAAMRRAGHLFFRSENGVWLTDTVPPRFLSRIEGTAVEA